MAQLESVKSIRMVEEELFLKNSTTATSTGGPGGKLPLSCPPTHTHTLELW